MPDRFSPIEGVWYRHDYNAIFSRIATEGWSRKKSTAYYRDLCKNDLFFLLYWGLRRTDVNREFIVEAIQEVEDQEVGCLDLWAREHYKSTIKTYARPIQDLIRDPEERIAIFSHTRPIAKGFLRQIKLTLETSSMPAVKWFPDIFYTKPKSQAPKWSEDDGLIVKRQSTPKESSIEAWGLVDGQPTSKHFTRRIYDDVVTEKSVTSPEQIRKTRESYELSQSLGTDGGTYTIAGTHYSFADLYMHLRKRSDIFVRLKPATDTGQPDGTPVLLSAARLAELRREQGPYIFACQQLLNPVATDQQQFRLEWLRTYVELPQVMNRYLLCDPANEKKRTSDWTVMLVVGVDANNNRLLLDGVRLKLNLRERWDHLVRLRRESGPIEKVGYEQYGMQADIGYFEERMKLTGNYFEITPLGGKTSKLDRIGRLVPVCSTHRLMLPVRLIFKDQAEKEHDLVKIFVDDEYSTHPYSMSDDILDCLARIEDPGLGVIAPEDTAWRIADLRRHRLLRRQDIKGI